MGKLYITEFRDYDAQSARAPAAAEQVVTYTTTTQSAAFGADTRLVRIHTDSICSIAFGLNPTATTSTARLAAGQTEYFAVEPGMKVAAVSNT
jgi:hypothetical protein